MSINYIYHIFIHGILIVRIFILFFIFPLETLYTEAVVNDYTMHSLAEKAYYTSLLCIYKKLFS
jgi:hypothetical protein